MTTATTSTTSKKRLKSWVYQYLEESEPSGKNDGVMYTCILCHQFGKLTRFKAASSFTSNVVRHIKSIHKRDQYGKIEIVGERDVAFRNHTKGFPSTTATTTPAKTPPSKRKKSNNNCEQNEILDDSIAKFFYRTGIPFDVADCPEWQKVWSVARPTYTAPDSTSLTTTLLEKTYDDMKVSIQSIVEDASSVTIVADGWASNSVMANGEGLITFILNIPNRKPLFYGAIDCHGEPQTSEKIATHLLTVIEEIGPQKVNAIVTDTADCVRGAWEIIETKYPHIFANGCAAHVLNLVVHDICSMDKNQEVVQKATEIVKFIRSTDALFTAFIKAQEKHYYKRELTLPVKTQSGSHHECLCNLVGNMDIVQQLCTTKYITRQFQHWEKFQEFIAIVTDDSFWDSCVILISKIKLPSKLAADAESDKSSISRVYCYFQEIFKHDMYSDGERLKIKSRWNFIHTQTIGFAYILNPATKGGLGMMENDFEDAYAQLEEYFGNKEELLEEFQQFIAFAAEPGGKFEELFKRESFNPKTWWIVHGRNRFPLLSELSSKIFAIPTSYSSSERVWCVFNLTYSKNRKKLTGESVNKLAYVYINSQLVEDQKDETADIDYFLREVKDEKLDCVIIDEFNSTV